jgi:hypothetical protein
VEAEFLGMNGKKIRLHKVNGVIIEVPLEKMSSEDTAYLKKVTSRSNSNDDDAPLSQIVDREQRRDERHRRAQNAATASESRGQPSSSSTARPSRSNSSSQPPPKKPTDWFDFFLAAGCELDDCTRYALNFERDRIEEDLLLDLEPSTMRNLGLREGDVIRVTKYIEKKYAPPPTPNKSDRDAQIAIDSSIARAMGEPIPPAPGLFTSANGGLKTTRRGRPAQTTRQSTLPIDSSSLATATSELTKRGVTPPIPRVVSPGIMATTSLDTAGFDDDAWTVKAAPPPVRAPVVVISPVSSPPAIAPPTLTQSPPPRAESAGAPPQSTLSYNDGLLAQLGIGARPPSAPAMTTAPSYGSATTPYSNVAPNMYSPLSQPQPPQSFAPMGPRPPTAPVPLNQSLLNPLIPTQTGMNFVPTRASPYGPQQQMPMMTGYHPPSPMGYQNSGGMMMPQMTGMPMHNRSYSLFLFFLLTPV